MNLTSRKALAVSLVLLLLLSSQPAPKVAAHADPAPPPSAPVPEVVAPSAPADAPPTAASRPQDIPQLGPEDVERLRKTLEKFLKRQTEAVRLLVPKDPLYVGSYARVPVEIARGVRLRFDQLRFRVAEGPPGGTVSESRDATFDPKRPDVMLIAGYQPGKYTLEALTVGSDLVVARAGFEVTVKSPAGKLGPSAVIRGRNDFRQTGAAWGGGPSGRQNVGTTPALGTHRIALIFADTNEQRYTSDGPTLDGFRQRWREHLIDGVSVAGVARSVRRYYQEASGGRMDISLQTFGPYQLDGNWDEVGPVANNLAGHAQAAITAADADINYNNFDTVIVVSQSVGAVGAAGSKFAWPTTSIGRWGGWSTAEGSLSLGVMQMPNDWTDRDGNHRQIYATASHELAHSLGLGDLYTPAVSGRNLGAWELMAWEADLPNFSLAHKMRLGWVDEAWVRGFNFATLATPVDETVTLSPASGGAPSPGRFVGVEVRVTDGLNYYFEYRKDNAAQISDGALPTNNRVFGTDVRSGSFAPPFLRPDIILLPNDSDGDGPVLDNGNDYRETDSSTPIFPVEFRAEAGAIDGTTANLRVRYGVNEKPDPSIRPWGAPPWQTPDIEVRNARNNVDPAWFNVPWQANLNTVVAKVKNNGGVDAPGVSVNFFVKNYNIGGAPELPLGSDTKDIPAGATVEFTTNWTPPTDGHFCIIARIPLYVRPGTPSVPELTELNNIAQSNYDRFISPTASPAERKITSVAVGNPFDLPTRVYVSTEQTDPSYRTYLEHKWLDLGPGETRQVAVMFEYVGGSSAGGITEGFGLDADPVFKAPLQTLRPPVNRVNLVGIAVDPRDKTGHHMVVIGGAGVEVATGRAVKFDDFGVGDDGIVNGTVTTADGQPVTDGTIIVTLTDPSGPEPRVFNRYARPRDGRFRVCCAQGMKVRAYYVPPPGYGDATSREVSVK
jgi:M6 family metalloprotease-like protein